MCLDHENYVLCYIPQLSSEDISASLGEESLLEDRDEEPQQESKHAPHPAGQKQPQSPRSCVNIINIWLGNFDFYLVDLWYCACSALSGLIDS